MAAATGIVLASMLVGCGPTYPIYPELAGPEPEHHLVRRNYTVGKRQTAYVNQPMVKIQDYHVVRQLETATFRPESDFSMTRHKRGRRETYRRDKIWQPLGRTEIEGESYAVLVAGRDWQGRSAGAGKTVSKPRRISALLVSSDGRLFDKKMKTECCNATASTETKGVLTSTWTLEPEVVMFRRSDPVHAARIIENRDYANFELLYSGRSGDHYSVLYKEYSREDLSRPVFTQTLTYHADDGVIRFRDLHIRVHEATDEAIEYTVFFEGL